MIRRRALLAAPALLAAAPPAPTLAPAIRQIALPDFPGRHAIWGATGQDSAGRVWFGVSADGGSRSGHLYRYDPATDALTPMGDVLAALGHPQGVSQIKIHSHICPAGDGFLYFTSTDEDGEVDDGSAPPTHGSHLWRIRPEGGAWQHLAAVPEGLTCAMAGAGQVWALGLWNHVLYHWNPATAALSRRVIGAAPGHMSRNFLVDRRGHAFVPRVHPGSPLTASLVEIAPGLREIRATPLPNYANSSVPGDAHGIIGFATLPDGAIAFATSIGFLHLLHPGGAVEHLGFLHPDGPAYTSALFAFGPRRIAGLARRADPGGDWRREHWDWIDFDLARRTRRVAPFETGIHPAPLLYGSDVRDAAGRCYIGGRLHVGDRLAPLLLQVSNI